MDRIVFLIGAVSISALPPTNGFVSEWLVFQGLFLSSELPSLFLKLMLPIAAAMLALTGALALACFAKAFGISFLALPRSSHARKAQEIPIPMRIGMGFLAGLCLVLGLGPTVVELLLDRVSEPFVGISISGRMFEMGGMTLAPVSEEFSSLSTPVLAMVLIGLTGSGLGLAYVLGGKGKKRFYKTWGVG